MRSDASASSVANDIVAVHFIDTPEGITVIDARLAGYWKELIAELRSIGRSVSDVRGVILTHGDSDHLGFAERLRRDHGLPIYVHSADAVRARGELRPKQTWSKTKLGPVLRFLGYAARKGGLSTTYVAEVVEIANGDVLPLPGSPHIIGMPGHSPGSVAVHVASADATRADRYYRAGCCSVHR